MINDRWNRKLIEKEFETVLYEKKKSVGYITLNRPEKHNALSYQLLDDIDAVFDYAEEDNKAKVIILKGAGKSLVNAIESLLLLL